MTRIQSHRCIRGNCAATAFLLLVSTINSPVSANGGFGIEQERDLAELKAQAFDRLAKVRGEALAQRYPERTRLSVYVGVGVERFRLKRVTVYIDEQRLTAYEYRRDEAEALNNDDRLHRVSIANVEPGSHRVRVTFEGHLTSASDDLSLLTGEIELDFNKGSRPRALILPVVPQALRPNLHLNETDWQWEGEVADPRLQLVRFYRHIGAAFPAMMELQIMGKSAEPDELAAEYYAHLAHAYLDFSMRAHAKAALDDAVKKGLDQKSERDVQLRLANLIFKREEEEEARSILEELGGDLPPQQLVRWQGLMGRILTIQGRYDEAVKVFNQGNTAREVLTEPPSQDKQTLVMRYNHAIALLKAGDTAKGRTLLDRLGRMQPFNAHQWALRDQANLTLAYNFLKTDQGATAKKIFHRIRLNGPYTDHAILGLGWAEIAPRGEYQQRVLVGDEPKPGTYGISDPDAGRINREDMPARFSADAFRHVQLRPFTQARQADSTDERLRRALRTWKLLSERSVASAAVLEHRVDMGHAFERLGAEGKAMTSFKQAIDVLERMRERLKQLRGMPCEQSKDDRLPDADTLPLSKRMLINVWRKQCLSGLERSRWMKEFFASNEIHALAEHYLDLYLLSTFLPGDLNALESDAKLSRDGYKGVALSRKPEVGGLFESDHETELSKNMKRAIETLHHRLRELTGAALEERIARLKEFLISARLGLARVYESRLVLAKSSETDEAIKAVPETSTIGP